MKEKIKYPIKIGLIIGFIGAILTSILILFDIFTSRSSTAAVALIFLPVVFIIAFTVFFVFGYSIGYIFKEWRAKHLKVVNFQIIFASFIVIFVLGFFIISITLSCLTAQIDRSHSSDFLSDKFNNSFFRNNKFVLGAIAQNSNTSPEILDKIAKLNDLELHHRMNSILPLTGQNKKGLAVMRLVVLNANSSAQTIEYLALTTQDEYVFSDIARNSKTSVATLRRLEEKKNYLIDWSLASNPNTPVEILRRLEKKKEMMIDWSLADNPSTPVDLFSILLERNSADKVVASKLLNNPSVSKEVKDQAFAITKSLKVQY